MHPALSVIFFTTLSGAGYGLLFWAAWHALTGASAARTILVSIVVAIVLSTIGLLSSMLHLGKPARACGTPTQTPSADCYISCAQMSAFPSPGAKR